MQFTLTEEQALLRDSAQRYLAEAYAFDPRRAAAGFDVGQWRAFAEMGWLALALPESAGGLGQTVEDLALLHQALGHALVIEPVAAVATLAAQCLCRSGAAGLDDAAAIAAGSRFVALAHHEAGTDGGAVPPQTRADADAAGRWVLRGRKMLVHGGPRASAFIVSARLADGAWALFRVPADTAGLRCSDRRLIDGSGVSTLDIDATWLAAQALLCRGEAARQALAEAQHMALVAACAESLGVMERALEATRTHLLQRRQFGVAIASFQALQHRFADMVIATEQARGALHAALAALHGPASQRQVPLALAKARVGRSARFVTAQAIQLHGGMGMSEECIVGHCFKRALVLDQWLGDADAQLAAAGAGGTADDA